MYEFVCIYVYENGSHVRVHMPINKFKLKYSKLYCQIVQWFHTFENMHHECVHDVIERVETVYKART